MSHRKAIARLVWHFNHNEDTRAFWTMFEEAGYRAPMRDTRADWDEYRVSHQGQVVAVLHVFNDGEMVGFVFEPEAHAAWYSRLWWRLTHPLTPLAALPWPRRNSAALSENEASG